MKLFKSIGTIFKNIGSFFSDLVSSRSTRIEVGISVFEGVETITESKLSTVLISVLTILVPVAGTVATKVKSILTEATPEIIKILKLLDVADNSTVKEERYSSIIAQLSESLNKDFTNAEKAEIKEMVYGYLEDNKDTKKDESIFSVKEAILLYNKLDN